MEWLSVIAVLILYVVWRNGRDAERRYQEQEARRRNDETREERQQSARYTKAQELVMERKRLGLPVPTWLDPDSGVLFPETSEDEKEDMRMLDSWAIQRHAKDPARIEALARFEAKRSAKWEPVRGTDATQRVEAERRSAEAAAMRPQN